MTFKHALKALWLAQAAVAGFPPTPEGVTTLKSKIHPGVSISYKEPKADGISLCETTPGVKSYAGYVHLPPNALNETHEQQDYPINTFFWFFESRKDPANAPLSIWLNGGPGGSSLFGALSENGPCFVGNDSNSTYLNPWSWNNEVNILYIDQPNQVGYSYDVLTNVTVSLAQEGDFGEDSEWSYQPADFSDGVPDTNLTFRVGTTGSQNVSATANTTSHAAVAIWHFAQTWFTEFPHYKPADEQISLFTESYGGKYGPAFVSFFMHQNALIANGTLSGQDTHNLHMNTLGVINGCIDEMDNALAYATFAVNNTYGVKVFNDSEYAHAMHELDRPGGIKDRIIECQRRERELDNNDYGDQARVNDYCRQTSELVNNATIDVYFSKNNGWYDVTHPAADPFPPAYLMGFLNRHWVQKALGVPVNHTIASEAVAEAFAKTGDIVKGGLIEDIAYILDHGVKVAMLYGDRDYACNWAAGEQSSLKIPWSSQKNFGDAGYTPLVISPVHSAGLTRQYGNLSFTRVYQAGHLVPSYQPEAAYEIFMRALTGKDIATGTVDLQDVAATGEQYVTKGSGDAWRILSDVLPAPRGECYYLNTMTCTKEEKSWLFDGTAIVKDWIVIGRNESAAKALAVTGYKDQIPLLGDW